MERSISDERSHGPERRRTQEAQRGALETAKTWSPEGYAECVREFARSTGLYHGEDYENLAKFLMRPFEPGIHRIASLGSTGAALSRPPISHRWSPTVGHVIKPLEDIGGMSQEDANIARSSGSMLILSGLQTPEWVTAIGARYHLDPAFFNEHLHFKSNFGRRVLFSTPTLPSATESIVRLRYFTIGGYDAASSNSSIGELRARSLTGMSAHMKALNNEYDTKQGDSIVRKHYAHSRQYFSIMQQMTIGMHKTDQGFEGVTWIDSGHDLDQGPIGPWRNTQRSWKPYFLPTILHSPKIALKWQRRANTTTSAGLFVQTAPYLCENYGRSLDEDIMCSDAFYAISELFHFAASSICQVLNLVEETIARATVHATSSEGKYDVSDLSYHHQLLDDVASILNENIRAIEARGGTAWPRAKEQKYFDKAERTAESLLTDYRELLSRARTLAKRCNNDMRMIMNQAAIAESQRSFVQAEKVGQLTWLAFMFVPLTFTTSFLGMNLKIFGQGTIPVWVWFAITAPLMTCALVLFLLGNGDSAKQVAGEHMLRLRRRSTLLDGIWKRGTSS